MARENDALSIPAEARRVRPDPADRRRAVLEELRIMDLGNQPVIRDGDQEALGGERPADKGIAVLGAGCPGSAVEEDDDGEPCIRRAMARSVQVQAAALTLPEGLVARHAGDVPIGWNDGVEGLERRAAREQRDQRRQEKAEHQRADRR
jgi:hypothetical protein